MTPAQFAAALGRDASYVSRVETGRNKTMAPPEEIRAIARALRISTADLLRAAGYLADEDDAPPSFPPDVLEIAQIAAGLPEEARTQLRQGVEWFARGALGTRWPISTPSLRSLR